MQSLLAKSLLIGCSAVNFCKATLEATVIRDRCPGKVLLLNGITSAGKTSIVKAIQSKSLERGQIWLAMGVDKLWAMMPRQYLLLNSKADEGFKLNFETSVKGAQAYFSYGKFGNKVARSFLKMLRRLVLDGHNLIIDEVLCDIGTLEPHLKAFEDIELVFVGVNRDLCEAVEIEALRGDRPVGLARGQIDRVHKIAPFYDLEVNTSKLSIFKAAEEILDFMATNRATLAFEKIRTEMFCKNQFVEKDFWTTKNLGKVVLLNGASSAGKTSITRALQHEADFHFDALPWLSIGADLMWDVIPSGFIKNTDTETDFTGFVRQTIIDAQNQQVTMIKFGNEAQKIAASFIKMTRQLVLDGLNIVVDEVLCDGVTLQAHVEAFGDLDPLLVGVFCDKKVALERELLRSDRAPGLALGQINRVHDLAVTYDLKVDTSRETTFDCARSILKHLEQKENYSDGNVAGRLAAKELANQPSSFAKCTQVSAQPTLKST